MEISADGLALRARTATRLGRFHGEREREDERPAAMEAEIVEPPHHLTREGLAFRARTAMRLGWFHDAIEATEMLVEHYGQQLTAHECNLIRTAFTSAVWEKTRSLRLLAEIEGEGDYSCNAAEVKSFRDIMALELSQVSNKGARIIEHYLLPLCESVDERLVLLKMTGDLYWHHLSFAGPGDCIKPQVCQKILHHYEEAISMSKCLVPAHPTRLSVELNLSAFYCEIMHDGKRAWLLANQSIAHGTKSLGGLDESSAMISRRILKLVEENMTIWVANKLVKDDEEMLEGQPEAKDKPVTAVLKEPKNKKCLSEPEVVEPKTGHAGGKPVAELQPEPDSKPVAELQPEPDSKPVAELQPEPDSKPVAELQPEPDAVADPVPDAVAEPELPVWKTPYSTRSPSPVTIREVPLGPRLVDEDPPYYEPARTKRQIRKYMKLAQAKRGAMG